MSPGVFKSGSAVFNQKSSSVALGQEQVNMLLNILVALFALYTDCVHFFAILLLTASLWRFQERDVLAQKIKKELQEHDDCYQQENFGEGQFCVTICYLYLKNSNSKLRSILVACPCN